MLLVWIYVALAAYNTGYLTLKLDNVETIVDEAANIATVDRMVKGGHGAGAGRKGRGVERRDSSHIGGEARDWKALWSVGTDAVMDVPLGGVCEVLYGEGRELESDQEEG